MLEPGEFVWPNGCVVIDTGSNTVTIASRLLTWPSELLAVSRYAPEFVTCAFAIVRLVAVAPARFVPLNCH